MLENIPKNIYDFIVNEELEFAKPINILDWNWSFADHVKTSFYYKHGRLLNGNDDNTPVKNIVKPILNMQYWAEDIDVKDIVLFITNPDKYHLSFLVKKYHDDVFLKENNLDEFIDEVNQSRVDYGLGLVMDVGKAKPERMNLESIAFCNQSDVLAGPIGFKLFMSPSDLQEMADRGWGDKKNGATHTIDETIALSRTQLGNEAGQQKNPAKVAGKYIQAYLVLGVMPEMYLGDSKREKYVYQMQVVCFYKAKDANGKEVKQGITLFRKKIKNPLMAIKRDPVFGRACGSGGVEDLFEPQAWTTYSEIQKKEIVDAAAKIVHLSDDEEFVKRNNSLKNVSNNSVLLLGEAKTVRQMDTYPRSIVLLEKSVNEWQAYAQEIGGAPNPLMGKEPVSGTPFALQNLVVQTGKNPHDWRRGQYAKFIEEVYRKMIIPKIAEEITDGTRFLSTLGLEEMQAVADKVVINRTNELIKNKILSDEIITQEEIEAYKQTLKQDFMKDNHKFIEILKDELKDISIDISINVAGKQKNLAGMADAVSNIMRQALSTYDPNTKTFAIFDDPRMGKLFNQILEYSNMSALDFNNYKPQPVQAAPTMQAPMPAPANV